MKHLLASHNLVVLHVDVLRLVLGDNSSALSDARISDIR